MDLILQPLKSELNWPLGVKRPLDFTRARPGSQLGNGLRWQVPFHLLEAFFYYTEGRMVVDLAFQDSRRWENDYAGAIFRCRMSLPLMLFFAGVELSYVTTVDVVFRWYGAVSYPPEIGARQTVLLCVVRRTK